MKKLKKYNLISVLLLVYTLVLAVFGWHRFEGEPAEFFGILKPEYLAQRIVYAAFSYIKVCVHRYYRYTVFNKPVNGGIEKHVFKRLKNNGMMCNNQLTSVFYSFFYGAVGTVERNNRSLNLCRLITNEYPRIVKIAGGIYRIK